MAAEQPTVGLNHPTVVPENVTNERREEHVVRCPACGRPLAEH